jgi:hypothetical protein
MFWKTIGRLILIPIAFLLSAAAAIAVAVTLGLEKITHAMHGTPEGIETLDAYTNLLFKGWDLLAGLSILPALAFIIVGEVAKIRSWLYYMIGGGLALASVPLLARFGDASTATAPPAALWQVLATAGFVGGLVYWLIAGRRA